MLRGRKLAGVAIALVLGACAEPPSAPPPAAAPPAARVLNPVRWADGAGQKFSVVRPTPNVVDGLQAIPPTPGVLSTNQVSFWAYTDQAASILVNYLAADGTWQPYVEFTVPAGSLSERPDGTPFASGDSVEITLTLDTTVVQFELEPGGLQFSHWNPARVRVWYTGVNPDFNGDGLVTFLDSIIEQTLLNLYTRATPSDPWDILQSVQSLLFKRFTADVEHFSGYALDW